MQGVVGGAQGDKVYVVRWMYLYKPDKRKHYAVRVHVQLSVSLTRIGTLPPMPRLRSPPRDNP